LPTPVKQVLPPKPKVDNEAEKKEEENRLKKIKQREKRKKEIEE
jgi:hypothetical protein